MCNSTLETSMMTLQAAERGKAKSAQAMVMLSAELSYLFLLWQHGNEKLEELRHILIENSRYNGSG
jgi:hypothetical protein